MITKNHPSAYKDLFAKAKDALSKYGSTEAFKNATITNIDDYFACLAELATIEENHPEEIDPIFTILPATEETFNIDANSRKISIPDNFARYGAGVQGDEIAEILYFAIDRYFDAMDLAEMDIIVQWKHESDEEHVAFLSATYKKSLTLQPGKVVFGWPITSEITERPGNIKFSIRFYRREEDTLIYSFSTLTTTLKIQTGLDFELNDSTTNLAINKNSQIHKNLRNSKKATVDYLIAAPTFTHYYVQKQDSEDLESATTYSYDLPIKFIVKAEIPKETPDEEQVSSVGITYSWYNKTNTSLPLRSDYIYQKINTALNTYNPKEVYYYINENSEYEPYYVVGDNNPFDDEIDLYVRCSIFEPVTAGTYFAIASNIYAPGAESHKSSTEWIVPGPSEATFTIESEKMILDNNSGTAEIGISITADGKVSGEWYLSQHATLDGSEILKGSAIITGNNTIYEANEEGYYFLKTINVKNNSSITSTSKPVWVRHEASIPVIDSTSGNKSLGEALEVKVGHLDYTENLSYQWQNGQLNNIEGATSSIYTPTSQGSYRCIITNTYKETVKTVESEWLAITPATD